MASMERLTSPRRMLGSRKYDKAFVQSPASARKLSTRQAAWRKIVLR